MVTMHKCIIIFQKTQYEHTSSVFLFFLRKENLPTMYYRTINKMVISSPLTPETPRRIIHGGVSHHPTTHTLLWEPTWNNFAIDAHGALSHN